MLNYLTSLVCSLLKVFSIIVLQSLIDPTKNIIKDYEQTKHFYKNISLILFSKGAHSWLLVWEIDGKTFTQRRDFFLSHIFFWEPGDANACTPLTSRVVREVPDASDRLCPWLHSRFSVLSLNLPSWLSRGFFPVTHLFDLTTLTLWHPPVY